MRDPDLPGIRNVFDASHHFMGLLSPEGILLDANRTSLEAAGTTLQEVCGRPFWEAPWWSHDPLQQARLKAGILRAAQGESFHMETTHPDPQGGVLVVDFSIRPLRDAEGRVVALLPEGRDISELSAERERLRLSEARFRSLLEHSLEAIVLLDTTTGCFREVNSQAEHLFKADRTRLLELGPAELSPPFQPDGRPSREAAREHIQQALDQGTAVFDWTHLAADGDPIPCEVRLLKLECPRGDLVRGSLVDLRPRLAKDASMRESERKFRLLFERSVEGLLLLDGGRFTDCNQAVLDMMRCAEPELLRMHPWDLSPPLQPDGRASAEKAMEMIGIAHAKGAQRFEWTHRRMDGEDFPVEVTLIPIPLGGKEVLFTSWRDITERKAAERALEENARTIGLIVDQTGQLVYDLETSSGRIRWFGALTALTGREEADLATLSLADWRDLMHPEDRARALIHVKEALRQGGRYHIEYRLLRRDGAVVWVEDTGTVLLDGTGTATRMLGSVKDIGERVRQEEALRASEERFRLMIRMAQDAFVLINAEGEQTFISPAAQAMTGFPLEELFGGIDRLIHPEDWPAVRAVWEKLMAHPEEAVRVEYRHIHKTKGWVWLEAMAQNCLHEPAIRAVAVNVRDMTDRMKVEQERLDMERQMLHAQKLESLGVLAGGIAHDFNNLLTAILGNLNLAQDGLDGNHPIQAQLKATERATLKASELTRQMLAYSGKGRFVVKAHDLNRVVREVTHLVQVSISKKVQVAFSLADDLPAIEADEAQIQQIILNLVTNANDAIGDNDGLIRISTQVVWLDAAHLAAVAPGQQLDPGPYCVLEVGDSGGGMTPEVLARIFDPFFTTKPTGHGLGLSAILGILRGHRAGLKVVSVPGQGTTFQVYFPALTALAPAASVHPDGSLATFSGLALLVDDESSIREVAAKALTLLGFEVESAGDGAEALEKFSVRPAAYRVALVDLTMPRMDGRECFRALRRLRPDLPVILTSGYSEQESLKAFLGEGLAGFIQKPYTLGMLRKAFAEALRG